MFISQNPNIFPPSFKHRHNLIKNLFLFEDFMRKIQSKQFLFIHNIILPSKQFFFIYSHPLLILTIIQELLISIIHIKQMSLNWLNIFNLTHLFQISLGVFVVFLIASCIDFMLILIFCCIEDYWSH